MYVYGTFSLFKKFIYEIDLKELSLIKEEFFSENEEKYSIYVNCMYYIILMEPKMFTIHYTHTQFYYPAQYL